MQPSRWLAVCTKRANRGFYQSPLPFGNLLRQPQARNAHSEASTATADDSVAAASGSLAEVTSSAAPHNDRRSTTKPSDERPRSHPPPAPLTRPYNIFDFRRALLRADQHLPYDGLRDPSLSLSKRLQIIDPLRADFDTRLRLLTALLDTHLRDSSAAHDLLTAGPAIHVFRLLTPDSTAVLPWRAALRTYHALLARLQRLAVEPPPAWLVHGLLLAARARDAPSLRAFAGQLHGTWPADEQTAELLPSIVSALRLWIRADCGLHPGPGNARRAAQLRVVLTAQVRDEEGGEMEPYAARMFAGLLDGMLRVKGAENWAACLRDLGGVEAVRAAWELRSVARPWERREGESEEAVRGRCEAVKRVVDALAEEGGAECAWRIVNEWGASSGEFPERTVRRLLKAKPDGLAPDHRNHQSWLEAIAASSISLLEEAEASLQVRWTGGEDGWHMMMDESGLVEANEAFAVVPPQQRRHTKTVKVRGFKQAPRRYLEQQDRPRSAYTRLTRRYRMTEAADSAKAPPEHGYGQFTPNF